MDYSKLQDKAQVMASKAKAGTLRHDGETYTFTFDANVWLYTVTDSQGETVKRYNTKTLAQAKKWLKDYLEN